MAGPQQRLATICRHFSEGTPQPSATVGPLPVAGGFLNDAHSFMFDTVHESGQHAGPMIAKVFKSHGVKQVFCLSGGHISPILVGAEQAGIRVIDVRHEVNAVFAADATARLTGIPGVAAVTAGPGITNTVTAIKNASMAQSPLVLIGGAAPLASQGRGALQDIDQRVLLEPIVKKVWAVRKVKNIVPALMEAFAESLSGVPGPVFVELPLDILYSYLFLASAGGIYKAVTKATLDPADKPRVVVPIEHRPKSVDDFLSGVKPKEQVFLRKLGPDTVADKAVRAAFRHRFAGSHTEHDVTPLPISVPLSPEKDVEAAAQLLNAAQRPVFLLGSQSCVRPQLCDQLASALCKIGAPAFLGGMSRGLLGKDNKYFIRQNRGSALAKADLVILVGTVVDFRLNYGAVLPKNVKIIAVSRDQTHLDLNRGIVAELSGGGWTATIASLGDAADFAIRLAERCPSGGRFDAWAGELKEAEAKKEQANRAQGSEPAFGRDQFDGEELINPIGLLHTLEDKLPDNALLVADGGDFVGTAAYILRPRAPARWLDPGAFGTLGVGGGFALGAALACPDSEVWLLWGDGAAGYSIAEFDTFARHNIPVIGLIGNDALWGQIEREQVNWVGSPVSCELEYRKYDMVAEGFGGSGFCVSKPGEAAAADAIDEARRRLKETRRPVLINALIGRTNFREGSISA